MIAAYAKALAAIVAAMTGSAAPLISLYTGGDRSYEAKKAFAKAVLPIVVKAREATHREAVSFTKRMASRSGVELPEHLIPEAPTELTEADIASSLFRVDAADPGSVVKAISRDLAGKARAPARELPDRLADVAPDQDDVVFVGDEDETFGNDLLEELAEDRRAALRDKKRRQYRKAAGREMPTMPRRRWKYARILTGKDDCAFCVMLASSGARYSSANRAAGSEYHPGCDCLAVVVFLDDLDARAQADADAMLKLWKKAQKEIEGVEGTKNDALNRFRRYLAQQRPSIPHTVMGG